MATVVYVVIIVSVMCVGCLFGWYSSQMRVVDSRRQVRGAVRRREKAEADVARLTQELARVYRSMTEVLGRDRTGEIVREIGVALQGIVIGPSVQQAEPLNLVENMDPSAPTQREWRPDIEMDAWMEDPELWPTHGGWVNQAMGSTEQVQGTPDLPPPSAQHPSNGRFASGATGPQPASQDET